MGTEPVEMMQFWNLIVAVVSPDTSMVFGDVTSDLSIPKIYYWIPLLAGFIGAVISAVVMMLSRGGEGR